MVAKISDLGNSRIVDLQPGQLARTLSRLPGTMVYMAPEAYQETSLYGTKLDMFSFGHLGLFTVIQVKNTCDDNCDSEYGYYVVTYYVMTICANHSMTNHEYEYHFSSLHLGVSK